MWHLGLNEKARSLQERKELLAGGHFPLGLAST